MTSKPLIGETQPLIRVFVSNRKDMTFSELHEDKPYSHGYLSVTQMNVMKSILTLLFVLTIGAFALANTGEQHVKINPIKVSLVLDHGTDRADDTKEAASDSDNKVVRLYRRENALVKKALRFSTKRTRAKLA